MILYIVSATKTSSTSTEKSRKMTFPHPFVLLIKNISPFCLLCKMLLKELQADVPESDTSHFPSN